MDDHPCNLESALDAVAKSRAIEVPHEYGLDKFLRLATGKSLYYFCSGDAPWLPCIDTVSSVSNGFSIVLATDGFTGARTKNMGKSLKQDKYSRTEQ